MTETGVGAGGATGHGPGDPDEVGPRPAAPGLTAEELAFLGTMFDHAREGRADDLAAAIDAGLPVNLTNGAGDSLLVLAAYHQHLETVCALLDRGADTARVNDKGQTAIAAATFRQHAEIVTALLDAGADPTLGPRSAVDIATFFDLPEMLALLTTPR